MYHEAMDNIKSAIEGGRTDIMRNLIIAAEHYSNEEEKKFSINDILNANATGEGTFLHLATKLNQCDIVRLLLTAGADPGIHNEQNETCIDLITGNAMQAVYVEELLKSTAHGNVGRVCQLLAAGIDIDSVDNNESGNTALHWAATFGSYDLVHCLIDRKANVNAINEHGVTPLHDAVLNENGLIVEELLKHGADPFLKIVKGKFANKTSVDLALDKPDILLILLKPVKKTILENGLSPNSGLNLIDDHFGIQDSMADLFEEGMKLQIQPDVSSIILEDKASAHSSAASDNVSATENNAEDNILLLWPQPQQLYYVEGKGFCIPPHFKVFFEAGNDSNLVHKMTRCLERHLSRLKKYGISFTIENATTCELEPSSLACRINKHLFNKDASYRLRVTADTIFVIGSDLVGFDYALVTCIQLFILFLEKKAIPAVQINDWPDIKYRGIIVDVTNDAKAPTLEYLFQIAENVSMMKINQILMHASFSSDNSWPVNYSTRDLLHFYHYCQDLQITVVPVIDIKQSNSEQDYYRLIQCLEKFLPCFTGSRFIYFGQNLSTFLFKDSDQHKLKHCLKSIKQVIDSYQSIFCCNLDCLFDEVLQSPFTDFVLWKCNPEPSEDIQKLCHKMNKSGKSFGIIPEIAICKSLCTCLDVSSHSLYQAIQSIKGNQSALAVQIVSLFGSNTSFAASLYTLPGYFFAAGFCWNCDFSWECFNLKMQDLVNLHIFHNKSHLIGKLALDLNKIETTLLHSCVGQNLPVDVLNYWPIVTPLHQLLTEPDNLNLEHLSIDIFQRSIKSVKHCQNDLAAIRQLEILENEDVLDEFQLIIDFILFSSRLGKALVTVGQNPSAYTGLSVVNVGISNLPVTSRTDFANKLLSLIEDYQKVASKNYLKLSVEKTSQMLTDLVDQLIPNEKDLGE